MTPKEIFITEWNDGDWSLSFQHPDELDNPYLQIKPRNVYKMEIDWRLLKNER